MLLLQLLSLSLCLDFGLAVEPLVDVGYTKYLGTALPNGISQWLGMRFAAPPIGTLRFRNPVDPPLNDTIQVADQVRRDLHVYLSCLVNTN